MAKGKVGKGRERGGRERLTQRVWNGSQSWNYEAMWQLRADRVRVRLRRNYMDEQSHLEVDVFSEDARAWNRIVWRPMTPEVECYGVSYVAKDVGAADFLTDEAALLDEAELVLFGKTPVAAAG